MNPGVGLDVIFSAVMALCTVVTLLGATGAAYVNLKTSAMLRDYATKQDLRECREMHAELLELCEKRKANADA